MSNPIRMCIICKMRLLQKELQRVQIDHGELIAFTKTGRSFYLCTPCVMKNEKKLIKILNNKCKTNHKNLMEFGKLFKETGTNG